jgi:hypothetical protein
MKLYDEDEKGFSQQMTKMTVAFSGEATVLLLKDTKRSVQPP